MPHIAVKMYRGRSEDLKKGLSQKLTEACMEALGIGSDHISVTIEDYDPADWGEVVKTDIDGRADILYVKGGKPVK